MTTTTRIGTMSSQELAEWTSFKVTMEAIWPFIDTSDRTILEMGMGQFSTPYLASIFKHVISVEENDDWWAHTQSLLDKTKIDNVLLLNYKEADYGRLYREFPEADIAFIDGGDRHDLIHKAIQEGIQYIFVHDHSQNDISIVSQKGIQDYCAWIGPDIKQTTLYTADALLLNQLVSNYNGRASRYSSRPYSLS